MVIRCGKRWLSSILVALMVAALGVCAALTASAQTAPQEPILWARNVAGDSRAIQVNADDAVTWVDQGKRIMLLKGKVWIEQGDANLRATQAVVWIDEAAQKANGIYHVEVYSDGGVSLEVLAQSYQAPVGMIELNTRGIVNVKTFKSKVAQKAAPDDPLFQRAVAAMKAQKAQPKPKEPSALLRSPIQPVSDQQVVTVNSAPPPSATDQFSLTLQQPGLPGFQQPVPTVVAPGTPGSPGATLQPPPLLPVEVPVSRMSIKPRSSEQLRIREFPYPNGEKAVVISPGVIIEIVTPLAPPKTSVPAGVNDKGLPLAPGQVVPPPGSKLIGGATVPPKDAKPFVMPLVKTVEIAADRMVVWTHGDVKDLMDGTPVPQGQAGKVFEFYLGGNVEIHDEVIKKVGTAQPIPEARVLRGSEAYYLFEAPSHENPEGRNIAVILNADLEERQPGLPDPIHTSTPELHQRTDKLFDATSAQINASRLPYGPGLYLTTGETTLETKRIEKKSILGNQFYYQFSGEPEYTDQLLFRAKNVFVWLEGVPVFWLPYVQGDARDPLGPLESISAGYSRAFGFQLFTTWNVFDLFGVDPVPGTHWRVDFDYFSARGFTMNTEFGAIGKNLGGISGNYFALVKAMGINDTGPDILGGNRGEFVTYGYPPPSITLPIVHPEWRGRFFGQLNWQELPFNLTIQTQLAAISDKNFLDQYFNTEWTNGLNQETYAYVKQQENNWALSLLFEPRIRDWITETEWLPRVDGYWIGQDFLDTFTYSTKASAAYANFETTHQPPPPYEPTDLAHGTGRVDWWNELALPLQLGAFKIVPYGVVDSTYYTDDLNNNNDFRFMGGGGFRGSIPFSRLYPDVQSELMNLDGIYHKIVLSGNYYWVHSDRSHLNFPQLDRLNDDESDQSLRDIFPQQPTLNPANAAFLNSGFFDPQLFALRKLVNSYVDTLDSIEEVELDLRQRWQTKRGFPGNEHIVDWMTLDVSASFFPQPSRDNFGEVVNFLAYDWTWSIGDRVTLFSSGWFDPHPGAARVWSFGTDLNRPDGSSVYLGYRQIDPLQSRQVIASVNVPFSAKYSLGASTSYDFGTNTQVNSFTVTRKGTDVMVSLGLTYNSILNSVGFTFEVYPNLLPATKQIPGLGNVVGAR